jgi:hypothetical protein
VDDAGLKEGKARQLETLNMLRAKVIKAAWAKGEASAGYWEALRGGDRPLSDEIWQERLTARAIHSQIVAARGVPVAGDKDAKEIRRLAKKLGIRLAQDQPGRKWKWPPPPKEPKQPRGRSRTRPEISFVSDTEAVEASKAAAERGKIQKARLPAC